MYDFLFVRSYGYENALARLQSAPLLQGLTDLGYKTGLLTITSTESVRDVPEHKHYIYHYDDDLAIQLLINIRKNHKFFSICITSDIYNIDRYVALEGVTDLFIAPTQLHKKVLSSAINKSLCVVPECIDSIAYPPDSWVSSSAEQLSPKKILWFGYPESFLKSFKHLMPAFSGAAISISDLVLITKSQILINHVEHRDFDCETFYAQTTDVRYSLLSHFSYDNQLNTWIKSPNKLVTSIVRGLVPFVSATPAYIELLAPYGLTALAFARPDELRDLLLKRESVADVYAKTLQEAAMDLERELSVVEISKKLLSAIC